MAAVLKVSISVPELRTKTGVEFSDVVVPTVSEPKLSVVGDTPLASVAASPPPVRVMVCDPALVVSTRVPLSGLVVTVGVKVTPIWHGEGPGGIV